MSNLLEKKERVRPDGRDARRGSRGRVDRGAEWGSVGRDGGVAAS